VASIRKRPGEGKNALLALLSVAEVKLAIVTDDDIDIYNPDELDWAMTFRVQADQDTLIIPGARGKHIDPSVRAANLGKGGLPTTAKLGIDATIPEGVPRSHYERLRYFAKDAVRLEDYR
jgi:2,5-furandicarboxylate decarboxylase 1